MSKIFSEILNIFKSKKEITNEERDKLNEKVKEEIKKELNRPLTEREKEIEEIARKEEEDYEIAKKAFYDNPIHWSNNKRRRHGLRPLRGKTNKNRSKTFHRFLPTAALVCRIEDSLNEIIENKFKDNEFFNQFVTEKNLNLEDSQEFFIGE